MRTKNNALLGDFVYDKIKEMILTGKIECGEKIQEQQIEQKLGVSRTPVREAVRRLSNEGIIVLYPNRHAEVMTFDKQSIKDLGMVRITLDCLAAQLAIQNGSNRDFDLLAELATKCQKFHDEDSLYKQIQYDTEFHLKLVEISANEVLIGLQKSIMLRTQLLQTTLIEEQSNVCDVKTHNEILDALYERDLDAVLAAIQKHLAPFYNLDAKDINIIKFNL